MFCLKLRIDSFDPSALLMVKNVADKTSYKVVVRKQEKNFWQTYFFVSVSWFRDKKVFSTIFSILVTNRVFHCLVESSWKPIGLLICFAKACKNKSNLFKYNSFPDTTNFSIKGRSKLAKSKYFSISINLVFLIVISYSSLQ